MIPWQQRVPTQTIYGRKSSIFNCNSTPSGDKLTLLWFLAIIKPKAMGNYIGYAKAYQWRISNNNSYNTQMQVSYNMEASSGIPCQG